MSDISVYIGDERLEFEGEINLLYQTDNPQEPDQGSAQKSFTLDLPLTALNRRALKHYDAVSAFDTINATGRIEQAGNVICEGVIYLLNTTPRSAQILIDGGDFFIDLTNFRLRQIEYPSHVLSITAVRDSWVGADKFYRYPLINRGVTCQTPAGSSTNLLPQDFAPLWRVRDILAEIIKPYTLKGDFFDTTFGKKLYDLYAPPQAPNDWLSGKDAGYYVNNKTHNRDTLTGSGGNTYNLGISGGFRAEGVTANAGAGLQSAGFWGVLPNRSVGTRHVRGKLHIEFTPVTGEFAAQTTINTTELVVLVNRRKGGVGSPSVQFLNKTVTNVGVWASLAGGNVTWRTELEFDAGYGHFGEGDPDGIQGEALNVAYLLTLNFTVAAGAPSTLFELFIKPGDTDSYWEFVWDTPCLYPGNTKDITPADYLPDITPVDYLRALRHFYRLKFFVDRHNKHLWVESEPNWLHTDEFSDVEHIDYGEELTQKPVAVEYRKIWSVRLRKDDSDFDHELHEAADYALSRFNLKLALGSTYARPGEQIFVNNLYAHTEKTAVMSLISALIDVPRLWLRDAAMTKILGINYPTIFNGRFAPRQLTWEGMKTGEWNARTHNTPSDAVATATGYPRANAINLPDAPQAPWEYFKNEVEYGKTIELVARLQPHEILPFYTIVNDITKEGFRRMFRVITAGDVAFYRVFRIVYDGRRAKLSMIMVGNALETYGLMKSAAALTFGTAVNLTVDDYLYPADVNITFTKSATLNGVGDMEKTTYNTIFFGFNFPPSLRGTGEMAASAAMTFGFSFPPQLKATGAMAFSGSGMIISQYTNLTGTGVMAKSQPITFSKSATLNGGSFTVYVSGDPVNFGDDLSGTLYLRKASDNSVIDSQTYSNVSSFFKTFTGVTFECYVDAGNINAVSGGIQMITDREWSFNGILYYPGGQTSNFQEAKSVYFLFDYGGMV